MFVISRRNFVIGTAAVAAAAPRLAWAANHDVKMLNKHPEDPKKRMVFDPLIVSVQVGDTVTFLPTDRGHNSASIDGMLPEGAETWDGKINKEISVTLSKPGFYGYRCTPHQSVGMVGLIIVEGDGKLDNLEAAQSVRQRGRAKKVWEQIWAEAESQGMLA
ncbi:MAG: pseudoazurin [Pseudomonadota bacterium]